MSLVAGYYSLISKHFDIKKDSSRKYLKLILTSLDLNLEIIIKDYK